MTIVVNADHLSDLAVRLTEVALELESTEDAFDDGYEASESSVFAFALSDFARSWDDNRQVLIKQLGDASTFLLRAAASFEDADTTMADDLDAEEN